MRAVSIAVIALVSTLLPTSASGASGTFSGVERWERAVRSNRAADLQELYSTDPPARYVGRNKEPQDISEEFDFWERLRAAGLPGLEIQQRGGADQQGLHFVSLTVSFKMQTPAGPRTRYVLEDQAWQQQGDTWRIVIVKHSGIVKMPQPSKLDPSLYPPHVDAKKEIALALARAGREHKRVILVFGANWCYDCHVLDFALHQPDIAAIANPNFVVVHVDIGEGKLNNDVAQQYKTPLDHGVPVLAVLDSSGNVLYSQQHGEFESARSMDPDDLVTFLNRWKP
jgi:hypothetical protein